MSEVALNRTTEPFTSYDQSDLSGNISNEEDGADSPLLSSIVDARAHDTESTKMRRVPDSIPAAMWFIVVIEACERFSYFGITGPLQNYIQNAQDDPLRPGGLGRRFNFSTPHSMT